MGATGFDGLVVARNGMRPARAGLILPGPKISANYGQVAYA